MHGNINVITSQGSEPERNVDDTRVRRKDIDLRLERILDRSVYRSTVQRMVAHSRVNMPSIPPASDRR